MSEYSPFTSISNFSNTNSSSSNSNSNSVDVLKYEVSITDSEKRGDNINSYTVYRINTTCTSNSINTSYSIQRRYKDFEWLRSSLILEYPGILVPPLPEKSIIGKFSVDFIDSRRRGLEKFLIRTLNNSILSKGKDVIPFLSLDEESLERVKLSIKETEKPKTFNNYYEMFQDFTSNVSAQFIKNENVIPTGDDAKCNEIENYSNSLHNTLHAAEQNTDSLLRRSKDLANAWFEFGLAFTLLGQYETEQTHVHLGRALGSLGHCADKLSVLLNQKSDQENRFFLEPIKYYLGILESLKEMLKTRTELALRTKRYAADLQSKREKLDLAKSTATSEKIALCEAHVGEATHKFEDEDAKLKLMTSRILEEVATFKREKAVDFKSFLMDYVRLQVEYAQKTQAAWESILQDINNM